MKKNIIPVEMICACSAEGKIVPLRFRYSEKNSERKIIKIDKILVTKETKQAGIRCIEYTVESMDRDIVKEYWLRYEVESFIWEVSTQ